MANIISTTNSLPNSNQGNKRTIAQKVVNRVRYYYSSGSPLRLIRKAALYAADVGPYLRRRQISAEQTYSDKVKKYAEELKREGFVSVTDLLPADLMKEVLKGAAERMADPNAGRGVVNRAYFGELSRASDYSVDSPFTKMSMVDDVVGIVSLYCGEIPRLRQVSLLLSRPESSKAYTESRLWHRDYDDTTTVKLFIYFTDVLEKADGPFTYIPLSESRKVINDFIPKRITDENMTAQGRMQHAREVYGKAGSAFLVDTGRCYHMGSRCERRERFAYVSTFTSIATLYPFEFAFPFTGVEKVQGPKRLLFTN